MQEIEQITEELKTLMLQDIEIKQKEIEVATQRSAIRKKLQLARQRLDTIMLDVI